MDSSESPAEKRRRLARLQKQKWRSRQGEAVRSEIRRRDAQAHRNRRASETPEQTQARLTAVAASVRSTRQRNVTDVDAEVPHTCGPMNVICQFCQSKNFIAERPTDGKFNSCCHKGKIKLPRPTNASGEPLEYPEFLRSLLMDTNNPERTHFRQCIRSYNSAVSFASLGAKIADVPGRGPYVFKVTIIFVFPILGLNILFQQVHGQTYHRTSHVQPPHGEPPQFAQLYMLDSTQATEVRHNHPASELLRTPILDKIDRFMRQNNVLAQHYTMMRQKMIAEEQRAVTTGNEIPVVNMVLKIDRQQDQRRYNAATADEVAMIFVNEDGEPPFNRDIRIYPKNPVNSQQQFLNLSILSSNLDPMAYALLYPYGEPGWQPNWQCNAYENAQLNRIRTNVTMLQYKVAQTAIRTAEFNPVMSAGKLTQQWLVDSYLQVEANNLNYIR